MPKSKKKKTSAKKPKTKTVNAGDLAHGFNGGHEETLETRVLRLEAANDQLKLLNLIQQRSAIEQQAQSLQQSFGQKYRALKDLRGVPTGLEVNLETGELYTPQQAPKKTKKKKKPKKTESLEA